MYEVHTQINAWVKEEHYLTNLTSGHCWRSGDDLWGSLSLTDTQTHTHSLTYSLSFSLTHTQTHTHNKQHTHTHKYYVSLALMSHTIHIKLKAQRTACQQGGAQSSVRQHSRGTPHTISLISSEGQGERKNEEGERESE